MWAWPLGDGAGQPRGGVCGVGTIWGRGLHARLKAGRGLAGAGRNRDPPPNPHSDAAPQELRELCARPPRTPGCCSGAETGRGAKLAAAPRETTMSFPGKKSASRTTVSPAAARRPCLPRGAWAPPGPAVPPDPSAPSAAPKRRSGSSRVPGSPRPDLRGQPRPLLARANGPGEHLPLRPAPSPGTAS